MCAAGEFGEVKFATSGMCIRDFLVLLSRLCSVVAIVQCCRDCACVLLCFRRAGVHRTCAKMRETQQFRVQLVHVQMCAPGIHDLGVFAAMCAAACKSARIRAVFRAFSQNGRTSLYVRFAGMRAAVHTHARWMHPCIHGHNFMCSLRIHSALGSHLGCGCDIACMRIVAHTMQHRM